MIENENKSKPRNAILEIEDEIIANFCELNGGMELAMPIIRKQYEKHDIDFKDPTKEELKKIANILIDLTQQIKGEEVAREGRRIFKGLLVKLEKL